ncbi:MAG: DUF1116 domain-containing protein [Clostridia bacterium]|nr:DUF1116 domain-containing protein [Clostridia bacterium]
MAEKNYKSDLRVINIGTQFFYDALEAQGVKATQINWRPPVKQSEEVKAALAAVSTPELKAKIDAANQKAVHCVIDSQPFLVDILPAGDVIEGLDDYTIIHSGPPIKYEDMVMLHQRGMVSACRFEGWAKTDEEAVELVKSGKVKIISALDTNTVGAGTGIITKSVAMFIIEDRATGKISANFPAEGPNQGGFCGWGLYSEEIADYLRRMREEFFPVMRAVLKKMGGMAVKPILAESFQMGDENHTRQTATDLIFDKKILPELFKLLADENSGFTKEQIMDTLDYIVETPRFFHCIGQGASRSAMLSAVGTEYSSMVTAICGNGVEFGIKVAGLGDNEWFTAPAPLMKGRYTSSKFTEKDQLPWIGDSCVVECAGMGGLAAAASPIVCSLRGLKLKDAIHITREMEEICIDHNPAFPVPNLDFDFLPVGIDIMKVIETGICPEIHGGMFNYQGGLIGAGSARVPMQCFEKAIKAFAKKYANK